MGVKPGYRVPRTASEHGDSIVVSLPKRELKRLGVDLEQLKGQDLVADVNEDRVTYELPD